MTSAITTATIPHACGHRVYYTAPRGFTDSEIADKLIGQCPVCKWFEGALSSERTT